MAVDRDLPTISSDPGGVSGSVWTAGASESIKAIWEHLGGVLTGVDQTDVNVVTGDLKYGTGFSAYTEPLMTILIPVAANTGAVTININSVGAVAIVRPDGTGLQAGDLTIGRPMFLTYVQALNKFVYMNFVDYSSITATLPQAKKRWFVDAALANTSSGTEQTICTFNDVQGAVGDILVFPDFRNEDATGWTNNTWRYGVGRGLAGLKFNSSDGLSNAYTLRFYKNATLVATLATFDSPSSTTSWDFDNYGALSFTKNICAYELDDANTNDYSIRIQRTTGSSAAVQAVINGVVDLFTPDGTFN